MSINGYCASLLRKEPEERYRLLQIILSENVFLEAIQLLPAQIWREFMCFEKQRELETSLKHEVSPQFLMEQIQEGCSELEELFQQWTPGDTFGYYHSFPGDTGYALIREGRVVDYCTCLLYTSAVTTEPTSQPGDWEQTPCLPPSWHTSWCFF